MTDQPDQPGEPVPPNDPTQPPQNPYGAQPPGSAPPPPVPPAGGVPPSAVPPPGQPAYGGPPVGPPPSGGSVDANVGAAWNWAWSKFGKHAGILIALVAVVFAIQLVGAIVNRALVNAIRPDCKVVVTDSGALVTNGCGSSIAATWLAAVIVALTFGIAAWIATIGIYRAALRATQGVVPSFSQLTTGDNLGKYVVTAICLGIAIALGLLACLIGSVVVAFLFQLAPFYALDRGDSVGQAFGNSYRAITQNLGPALLMTLITLVALAIGSATFGLLTLVLLPFASLFTAHMYRQFNREAIAP